jgi:hypothetical protein
MSSASDTELRATADALMKSAESNVPIVQGPEPGPDDPGEFWDSLSTRAQNALRKYKSEMSERGGPPPTRINVIKDAAHDIKGAAQAGLDSNSSATDTVRGKLRTAVTAAGALAIGATLAPFILPLLIALIVERSGFGGRARRAARGYVDSRAREYGF